MPRAKAITPKISNTDLWNIARTLSPQFGAHTAEGTAELFSDRGFSEIEASGITSTMNEFYNVIMPFYLQQVNISHARDVLDNQGFGEYSENLYGEYARRMAVMSVKPVTPAYRNLKKGPGPDPFIVRPPEVKDRFYQPNFDYQSFVTIPDDWMTRRVFTSEFGFSELLAGIYQGLENGYIIQKYLNKMEAISAGLNDDKLQPTQSISVTLPATPTEQQIVDFVMAVKDVISNMASSPQTSAFNALAFPDIQEQDRLRLLVRAGWKNKVDLIAARNSYNRDTLNLPIPIVEVNNFGGLVPYQDAAYTTQLYPVYDSIGEEIGFNTVAGSDEVTVQNDQVYWKDTHEDVVAILADKGWLFEIRQNPYEVETIRNPRGRYTNPWASSPNNTIAYDRLYTFIKFVNGAA